MAQYYNNLRRKLKPIGSFLGTTNLTTMVLLGMLLLSGWVAKAQGFPVQVIPQVTPPPPIYLSEYADATLANGPLRVQLLLNDFSIANREVRLRMYFEGNGLSFQSNPIVNGAAPIFLEGGVPLVLTQTDLAPYFQFENISGISGNAYGKVLAEGSYSVCYEVIDVLSGNTLSARTCAAAIVFQNEPPLLVMPYNRAHVEEKNPQNIVFQWTPRHLNVTNVEYQLDIVEVWDNQVDPQQAFLSSPPVFSITTNSTNYVYGPADPLLLSGKRYAWRVTAKALQGTEEIGLFKNQGHSEIYSFSYAGECGLPEGVTHEVKGKSNVNLYWTDLSTDVPEYTIRYRKKEGENNEWFYSKTTSNTTTLWDLTAGTTYEYQIAKSCGIVVSDFTPVDEFTTALENEEDSLYECGIDPNFSVENTNPLASLSPGDSFVAGDFPVTVETASGSNGRFTGTGFVRIPYLRNLKVAVEFTNVLVNTDSQLAEGSVRTVYDYENSSILDIDDAIDTIDTIAEQVGEFFEGDNDLDEITVNFPIPDSTAITVKDGNVVITNPANGATVTEPLGDDMVITDSEGNVYHVDAAGKVTKGGTKDPGGIVNADNVVGVNNRGEIERLTAPGIKVTFNTKGTYGMDRMPSGANAALKEEFTIIEDYEGQDYVLTHHAVKKGTDTQILASIAVTGNDYTAEDLIFKTKQGETVTKDVVNGETYLKLNGHYTLESETIYAVVTSKQDSTKQLTAGAFTLWHLTERSVDVALVAVNNAPLDNYQENIFQIFKQGVALVNFEEPLQIDINAEELGGSLDVGDSPFAAAYNAEQKMLINKVKNLPEYSRDTYYILVFNNIPASTGIAGFMPLQRQFGFVFSGSGEEEGKGGDKGKVLAHEMGHGIFALQHPFAAYGSDMENATDWLMDYNGGTGLPHMHWAQIHNPNLRFYTFQDEEDGNFSNTEDLTNNPLARVLAVIASSGNNGVIKCKKCEETSNSEIDGVFYATISNERYSCIAADLENNEFYNLQAYSEGETTLSNQDFNLFNFITENSNSKENILFLVNKEKEITECTVTYPLPDSFCNDPTILDEYKIQVAEEIEQCYDDILNDVKEKLIALKQNFRSNQEAQFVRNGNVYRLNTNDEVEVIENALTDAQIENGEWTDNTIDQIFKVYENESGVLQFKVVGIRNNLDIFTYEGIQRTADLKALSKNLKDKGNVFLSNSSYKVTNINDTPQALSIQLNNPDVDSQGLSENDFADGEQIKIKEDVSFFKIISEGAGKMGELLKTGEIEESTYLNSTKPTEIVHAPPIVTGSTEAATREVTDITGVVVMVYDLTVDKEVRQQTWNGLKQVKDQVVKKPSTVFPLLGDIALEELTGSNKQTWQEALDGASDPGKRGHITTKGAVRTSISVFTGGKLVSKLPEMATKLSVKMLRRKIFKQMDDLGWDEVLKDAFKADFDDASNIDFKELFEQADEVRQTELLKSWESVRDAIPNQSGTTQFALDPNTVNKVADYLSTSNADKLDAIGGIDELKSFITKHSDVPCNTCNGGGLPVFGSRTMDEMIENFVEVGHIFKDHPDLWQKLKIGTESANAAMREGTQHTLKVFKDNPSKYAPDNIADLDMKFESVLDDICANCRFDVKFTNAVDGINPKFAEFKSYNSNTWSNIKNSPKFIRQFKRYLQDGEISKLSDLEYIVNASKTPLSEIKTAFKEMLTKEAENLLKPVSQGGLGVDRIKQLFGNEILDVEDFLDEIDDITNDSIYDFIKSN